MSPKTAWEFECLNCGYRMAEAAVNQARFDYGCPRCGHSFEQFTYRKRRMGKMEAEMSYLLEEKTRKLENAEMLIERLKREVKELDFSVALHDRAAKKARAIWEEAHPDKAPEWPCREDLMVWLTERVEKAEAVKDSLTSALRGINEIAEDWNLYDFKQICDIAKSALRTAEEYSVVDSTPAKQPEGTTKLDKALQNIDVTKRVLVENSCPSEFGLEDCEFNPESGCTLCCEDCWNEEVTE